MSWAYDDKPEMTESLAAEYVKAGNQNDMTPIGNSYTAGLDATTVAFLQNTAWTTVKSFYGIN